MTSQLVTDIDALPHRVRDPNSKRLIDDALDAYRGGALRSAIVSTWIAVLYDIASKARELARLGDPALVKFVNDLDNAIKNDDHKKMIEIERNILEDAAEKFQIITLYEKESLQRIKEDRNKCAHLSIVSEDQVFQPSPDLVRSHIVHALQHLLVHAPLQGKSAIQGFLVGIVSDSFPSTQDEARKFFFSKYLERSKDVFVKNIIIIILKVFFLKSNDELFQYRRRLSWILSEISEKRHDVFSEVAKPFLGTQSSVEIEKNLLSVCMLLAENNQLWGWLHDTVRLAIPALIEKSNADELIDHCVPNAHKIKEIRHSVEERVRELDYLEQCHIIITYPNKHFVPLGIEIYSKSKDYKAAMHIGFSIVLPLAKHFEPDDIISILEFAMNIEQISGSGSTGSILGQLFNQTVEHLPHTRQKWIEVIENPPSIFIGYLRDRIDTNLLEI